MVDKLDASKGVKELILDSWSPKTRAQYEVYLRQWSTFCIVHNIKKDNPPLRKVHDFLCSIFKKGLSYAAVNSARCAISALYLPLQGPTSLGAHWMTSKVLKGIRRKRPPLSRYQSTWDVNLVLCLLRSWIPVKKLSLKFVSFKLSMLMLLTSCQRIQTLATLKTSDIFWAPDGKSVTFRLTELLKHTKRGTLGLLQFTEFKDERSLCVITVLREYLERTKKWRNGTHNSLFLSHRKPHDRVQKDAISGWVRTTMAMSGIDVSAFKAHSVRGASTSKLASMNIPVDLIMKKASWSSEDTFQRFYNKNIVPHKDVANDVLRKFLQEEFK